MKTLTASLILLGSVALLMYEIVQERPVYGLIFLGVLGLIIAGVYLWDLTESDDDTEY